MRNADSLWIPTDHLAFGCILVKLFTHSVLLDKTMRSEMKQKIYITLWVICIPIVMLIKWHENIPAWGSFLGISVWAWSVYYGICNALFLKLILEEFGAPLLLALAFIIGSTVSIAFEWWISLRNVILHIEVVGCATIIGMSPIIIYAMIKRGKVNLGINKSDRQNSAHGARIE